NRMGEKREVPPQLKAVLDWDIQITNGFVKFIDQNYGPLSKWKLHFKSLEMSCHGIPWILFMAIITFLISGLRWLSVNLFFALIFDIVVVAIVKAITRRRRPTNNKEMPYGTFGPDKFSFPSGHCTRATMVAIILIVQCSMGIPLTILLLSWSLSVSVSRVLLQRHHILDVSAGFVIGAVQALIVNAFWLSEDSAQAVAYFFLDETQAGASYDV
ncbi:unnamed protein product, partial [Meganyctiphanes norvegica]